MPPPRGNKTSANLNNDIDITPQTQREGALFSAHYDVTDSLDLFTEVLFSHRQICGINRSTATDYASIDGTVAANNPYNPFGVPVNVSFAYPGARAVEDFDPVSLIRPLIGVQGSFLSDWHYEVTAFFSRDQAASSDGGRVDSSRDYRCSQLFNPATALNPFASGAPGTPQLLSSLEGPGS